MAMRRDEARGVLVDLLPTRSATSRSLNAAVSGREEQDHQGVQWVKRPLTSDGVQEVWGVLLSVWGGTRHAESAPGSGREAPSVSQALLVGLPQAHAEDW